jgi:hypothetical protein
MPLHSFQTILYSFTLDAQIDTIDHRFPKFRFRPTNFRNSVFGPRTSGIPIPARRLSEVPIPARRLPEFRNSEYGSPASVYGRQSSGYGSPASVYGRKSSGFRIRTRKSIYWNSIVVLPPAQRTIEHPEECR